MSKWKMVKLGDVCLIERGGSPRPIDKYITTAEDGINWIKIGDTTDSMYITKTKEKIIREGMKKSRFVNVGDFLLSNSMSFGRPYILKIEGCIHDGWLVIRDERNLFEKRFLYYFLSSPITYNKFKQLAVGGVVNNLNSEMVRKVNVPIPPLEEQKRIADILDKASSLIELRKQQLEKMDLLIKSKFIDMFGDPVANSKGWKVKRIEELCEAIFGGGTPSKSHAEYYDGDIPWVTSKDMKSILISDSIDHINDKAVLNSSAKYIPKQSLLMVIRSGILKHTLPLGINTRVVTINQDMKAFIPNANINVWFMFYTFKMHEKSLLSNVRAVTADNIEFSIIRNLMVPVPSLELQNQFAEFVEQVEKQKTVMQQSLEKMETNYKALMQEYFG